METRRLVQEAASGTGGDESLEVVQRVRGDRDDDGRDAAGQGDGDTVALRQGARGLQEPGGKAWRACASGSGTRSWARPVTRRGSWTSPPHTARYLLKGRVTVVEESIEALDRIGRGGSVTDDHRRVRAALTFLESRWRRPQPRRTVTARQ
ncbi:hypothetical protein ACIGMX_19155 [Streptomyces aquilus]|uniref:hypothetical protein n=1 Tax=Streptomyces aquilus TaxID=2548456 RepID=UPI0037CEC1AD